MLLSTRRLLSLLFLLPLAAAVPQPTPAQAELDITNLHRRAIIGVGGDETPSASTRSAAQTSTTPSSTPVQPETSTTSSASIPASTTSVPPPPSSSSTSTSIPPQTSASASLSTNEVGEVFTQIVIVTAATSSSSATLVPTAADTSSSGPGTGTFIGVGVAGGIAVLGLAAFIVWKFRQKKFRELDDAGDINWPMPKEAELQPPAAPSMMAGTNATSSSIDLTHDPYAVPPLPPARNMPYHDDPSGSNVFYDPYRGPVPQTFTSPPQSTEGHNAYARGEAIPMSTYSSNNGRQSPGPNAAYDDPYARSGSPGPAAAYGGGGGDPYGARSRSPGPGMAYEDPYAGRRSPGPSLAYGGGGGGPNQYDPSVRMGTPVGGPNQYDPSVRMGTPVGGPGRIGTPVGGGYGGPPPPGLDMMRTGTPGGYRGPSPAPPPPGGQGYGIQPDPYGRYTPNPYGR